MPGLIDLQTDLKSLRYGSDKPYVTKDINNPPSSNQTGMQITKRVDDLSRISQMLIDRPGLKFLGNQALLQQVNIQDKLQKAKDGGKSIAGAILQQAGNTLLTTAKIVGSTLAQVPVNGTGTHFVYAFRTDTYLKPTNQEDVSAFREFFGAGGVEGAPLALQGKPIEGQIVSNFGKVDPTDRTKFEVTAESQYDYDEYFNTPQQNLGAKEKAQAGQPIYSGPTQVANIPFGGVTVPVNIPVGARETTATSGSLGISNKDLKGDVIGLEQPVIKPFREEDQKRRTKNLSSQNILNAQTGSAIPLSGSTNETTAKHGVENSQSTIQSISNTDIIGSTNPADELGLKQPKTSTYKRETPYGKNSSNYSNGEAQFSQTGSNFYNKEEGSEQGVKPGVLPIVQTNSVTRDNINTEIITTEQFIEDKYNSQAKYYEQQKGRTIAGSEKNVVKEERVNLGDQGKISFDRTKYNNTDPGTVDGINALPELTQVRAPGAEGGRDLAKFYFEIITPESSQFLHFRAFIDSVDDNYNADWQGFKYVGRAEEFYTYGGFSRDINISFKIAAATRAEMRPLYRKMVLLASSTAPTYGGQGFMRGTLARITIGSYFSQLPGVITSVKYSLIDGMPWEISMQSPEQGGDGDVQELPMGLQCSVSFKVIHDFAPQTGLYHYFTNPNPINAQDFLK